MLKESIMSFSVTPKAASGAEVPVPPSPAAQARQRAIEILQKGSAPQAAPQVNEQQHPVRNPTQVAPEEMSAVSTTSEEKEEKEGHLGNNEGESESSPSLQSQAETKTEKAEEPLSSQYALLARREKALRAKAMQQEQALKAKEAEIAREREAIKAKEAEYQSKFISKDQLKDPSKVLDLLSDLGLSYDELTQAALNAPKPEDIQRMREINELKAQIEELKSEQNKTKSAYEESQTRAYQQALAQIKQETAALVKNDPNFEAIAATNSIDDVVELIETTFKQDGILMTVEEAAQEVEAYLVEEAAKLARLNKIQQKLKPAEKPVSKPTVEAKQIQQEEKPGIKTLTNSMGTSRQLSARERAILRFKGENI